MKSRTMNHDVGLTSCQLVSKWLALIVVGVFLQLAVACSREEPVTANDLIQQGTLHGTVEHFEGRMVVGGVEVPHGTVKAFRRGGAVEVEGSYVEGLRDGTWKYYSEDGSIETEETWKRGVLVRCVGLQRTAYSQFGDESETTTIVVSGNQVDKASRLRVRIVIGPNQTLIREDVIDHEEVGRRVREYCDGVQEQRDAIVLAQGILTALRAQFGVKRIASVHVELVDDG